MAMRQLRLRQQLRMHDESGYEDRVERHRPGSFHWADENCSISLSRRRNADLQQQIRNHVQTPWRVTGPTAAIGESSESTDNTRSSWRSARVASAPQVVEPPIIKTRSTGLRSPG